LLSELPSDEEPEELDCFFVDFAGTAVLAGVGVALVGAADFLFEAADDSVAVDASEVDPEPELDSSELDPSELDSSELEPLFFSFFFATPEASLSSFFMFPSSISFG
jgi:hypothetical protein